MASIDRRSQVVSSTRGTRWQRARQLAVWLTVSSGVALACSTGPIGGGTGGTSGDGGRPCIDAGDDCTPGAPIPRELQCDRAAFDCCRNTCTCGEDGKVRCEVKCHPDWGSGGACGDPGNPCGSDSDCNSGLKCCYPCGIEGCENQCMQPMPNGQCPLFP